MSTALDLALCPPCRADRGVRAPRLRRGQTVECPACGQPWSEAPRWRDWADRLAALTRTRTA